MPKITPFKETSPFFKFLVIFLITLLIFYQVIPRIISESVNFTIKISELDGQLGSFSVTLRIILEVLFMGPFFAIIYYFLIQYLKKEIDPEEGKNHYYIIIIDICVITFISISCMGHIVHMMFDKASWLYYYANNEQMDTTELYSYIYYSDEILGHHLIHIGLFGYLITGLFIELLVEPSHKMRWDELIYTILLGIGMSLIGYATFEGQAAFMMVILWGFVLLFELIFVFTKKYNPLQRPIMLSILINCVIFINVFIIWVIMFGIKPYYPFIFQPSELR